MSYSSTDQTRLLTTMCDEVDRLKAELAEKDVKYEELASVLVAANVELYGLKEEIFAERKDDTCFVTCMTKYGHDSKSGKRPAFDLGYYAPERYSLINRASRLRCERQTELGRAV